MVSTRSDLPFVEFERLIRQLTEHQLGVLVSEYICESNYNGWDGFGRHHLTGIRAMMTDMRLYYEHALQDDPQHFDKRGYFTRRDS